MVVALPRLQYHVVNPQNQLTHTILQTTQPENGCAVIWLRSYPHSISATGIRPEKLLLKKLHHQKIKHTFAKNFEVWRQT